MKRDTVLSLPLSSATTSAHRNKVTLCSAHLIQIAAITNSPPLSARTTLTTSPIEQQSLPLVRGKQLTQSEDLPLSSEAQQYYPSYDLPLVRGQPREL